MDAKKKPLIVLSWPARGIFAVTENSLLEQEPPEEENDGITEKKQRCHNMIWVPPATSKNSSHWAFELDEPTVYHVLLSLFEYVFCPGTKQNTLTLKEELNQLLFCLFVFFSREMSKEYKQVPFSWFSLYPSSCHWLSWHGQYLDGNF